MQRIRHAIVNHPFALAATFLALAGMLVYGIPHLIPPLRAEKTANEKTLPAPAVNKDVEMLRDVSALPPQVARMRSAILGAAATGEVESLRVPIDMNELPPMLAAEKVKDPMAYWREISGDGEGREVMATLIQLFRAGFARKAGGTENEMYVWPYFAEMPLDRLSPSQEVELLTIVPPARMKEMIQKGKYDHFRIAIAKDGTWHSFMKE
jgi:hypothetical protein